MRSAHNVEHLPLHFIDALRGVDLVQASQPAVIRDQRLGLPFVRLQPGPDNFFAIIRPLLKLAAILHENYRSCGLTARVLGAYDRKMRTDLQPAYARLMASHS